MLIAIFPAIICVFSVFTMVHYEVKIHDIKGEKSEHSPMDILKREWDYTLPLIVITVLVLSGFSPGYSAILGIATFAGATIAKANMWKTAFASFKFAKFLDLSPFLFGYVPG